VLRNEFYDIDPFDSHSAEVKDILIFIQQDMLWIQKENYNIDMGWYGGDDLTNEYTGFCIYLYRGDHWNKCELLETFRSQRKEEIVTMLNYFIESGCQQRIQRVDWPQRERGRPNK
jgi:hypothetical protein